MRFYLLMCDRSAGSQTQWSGSSCGAVSRDAPETYVQRLACPRLTLRQRAKPPTSLAPTFACRSLSFAGPPAFLRLLAWVDLFNSFSAVCLNALT